MSDQEKQLEQLINVIDAYGSRLMFGLAVKDADTGARKWYTFSGLLSRVLRISAGVATDPAMQAVCVGLYGAIECLGVKGAAQLAPKLKGKHDASARQKQTKKSNGQV